MKNLKVVLIFSGYNMRAIIAFCRFATFNNINFKIIARTIIDPIFLSIYKSQVITLRNSQILSVGELIKYRDIVMKEIPCEKLIILPSTEYLNRFLISYKVELENHNMVIPLVNKNIYEKISDKYSFYNLCQFFGISVPRISNLEHKFSYPIVAKPTKYFDSDKNTLSPSILKSQTEYNNFLEKHDKKDFFFQEFIGGRSYYLLFYFVNANSFGVYSQENLIQQFNGKSIVAAESSLIHKHEITGKFVDLFISLNFSGLVMVEIKEYNNKIYMIEANPRLWGPSQLILDASMDLFHRFAFEWELIGEIPILEYKPRISYFWSGGIIQDQLNSHQLSFHNYDESKFFTNLSFFMTNDVYARNDSMKIYLDELRENQDVYFSKT